MTITKKILSIIVTLSLVLTMSMTAFAADMGGTVDRLGANRDGNSITVSGSTTDVTAAVFVQVLDGSNIIASQTFPVNGEGAFKGTINVTSTTLSDDTDYLVRAADLDGGEWKTSTISSVAVVKGYSLALDSYVGVKYYIVLDESLANNDTVVHFEIKDSLVSNLKSQDVPFAESERVRVGDTVCYNFYCKVAPAEMNIPISATLTNGDKTVPFDNFTVRDYANYIIEDEKSEFNTATEELAKAIRSYGYYAQVKFNAAGERYDGDAVPFDYSIVGLPVFTVPSVEGIAFYGTSVSFLSGAMIKVYYTITDNGAVITVNGSEQAPSGSSSVKSVRTDEISISESGIPIAFSITNSNGDTEEFEYNVLNYLAAVINSGADEDMKNLAAAYYTYYMAVRSYVNAG